MSAPRSATEPPADGVPASPATPAAYASRSPVSCCLQPERLSRRIMEAPYPPVTVEPSSDCRRRLVSRKSRSGPVHGVGDGVFQPPRSGKYLHRPIPCASEVFPPSSSSTSTSVFRNLESQAAGLPVPATDPQAANALVRSLPPRELPASVDLTIYYQNVGGINSIVDEYYTACCGAPYDIITFTETWLNDNTLASQVFGPDYEVFWCHRGPQNSLKRHGGGVAIAVRKSLNARLIENVMWKNVEQVWIVIKLENRNLYLCTIYIPPDRTRDVTLFESHQLSLLHIISLASPSDEVVILGDFNLSDLKWRPLRDGFMVTDRDLSSFSTTVTGLLDTYSTALMRQLNSTMNESGNVLDLCFIAGHDTAPRFSVAPTPLVEHVAHHHPLLLTLSVNLETVFIPSPLSVRYDYHKANISSALEQLSDIDWDSLLDDTDVDVAVQTFSNILGYIIDRHVPKKNIPANVRIPWMTPELRRLKTAKKAALKSFSRNNSLPLRDYYIRLNRSYKSLSRHCFSNHLRQTERKLKKNPKGFWKHINEQRKENGLPSSMSFEGEVASSQEEICRLFASKFSRMFDNEATTPSQVAAAARNVPLNGQSLNTINVDDSSLTRAAKKLKSSCSAGPDGIPSIMLKKCIAGLVNPLCHLFNLSLSTGTFPALWKIAYMFPVHKKGDKRNVDNYRGISALCATSKLFELVVLDPIFAHCRSLIVDTQHGFLPGRSTTTNLLDFTSYILDGMSKGVQTDAIYTDLSAAFDKLNHDIAIAKLERMGFCGNLLRWFHSYLAGRSLCVKIGDLLSFWFSAGSGIAQGSHLGPIVFLLYFNDSSLAMPSLCLSYADDLKMFFHIRSTDDAQLLQSALTNFADWCRTNRMILNPKKCCVISFSRKKKLTTFAYRLDNEVIPREICVKDLGVLLDSEMSFKHHVSYIVDKASRQLGFIFRTTKRFTDIYCLKSLFCSLVRSTLEYCSAVWSPYYQNGVKRIEDVQRRFIRFALRRLHWNDPFRLPSYESRCLLIHLDTLDVRRNVARALVVADSLSSRLDCPAILQRISLHAPSRPLREHSLIRLPFHRTNYCMYGAFSGILRVFDRVSSIFDFSLSRVVLKEKFLSYFRA